MAFTPTKAVTATVAVMVAGQVAVADAFLEGE